MESQNIKLVRNTSTYYVGVASGLKRISVRDIKEGDEIYHW